MNAVDAKATRCEIKIETDLVTIRDDGMGFKTKDDIQKWFEVFGAIHSAEEQKVFGTFRMGKGDKPADFAHRACKAFVISSECMADFGHRDVESFCIWLNSLGLTRYTFQASTVANVVDLARPSVLPMDKLLVRERKWQFILEHAGNSLYGEYNHHVP